MPLIPASIKYVILKTVEDAYKFPNFKKIDITDKAVFSNYSKFPTYSDFNMLSLLSWNTDNSNAFSVLNGNLIIKIKNYLGEKYLYSILGENDIDNSIKKLIDAFEVLNMVPQIVVDKLTDSASYNIVEDRDSFDYIISTEKISKLEGSDFKPLRRHVKEFEELYPNYTFRELDIKSETDSDAIFEVTKNWVLKKNFDEQKLNEELYITKAFLKYAPEFNCQLLGIFINGKLAAYTFNEIDYNGVAIGHFGKTDPGIESGAYFIEYKTSCYFYEKGIKTANLEQDTGLQGLRTAKMTYKPIKFFKKYTISKK